MARKRLGGIIRDIQANNANVNEEEGMKEITQIVEEVRQNRTFSKKQIDEFINEDQLPEPLATEAQKRWANKMK